MQQWEITFTVTVRAMAALHREAELAAEALMRTRLNEDWIVVAAVERELVEVR